MENVNLQEQNSTLSEQNKVLDKKTLNRVFNRWYMTCEMSNSFERLQTVSFCYSMIPALKKLYTKAEDFKESLVRHMTFFNTEAIWGSPIHGITCAMEEQKSQGADIPDAAITGLKTGLMGPLAGIGDTLTWGTIKTIIYSIGITFAAQGSALGFFIAAIFPISTYFISKAIFHLGYNVGRDSVRTLLQDGMIHELIEGTGIMGLFMMGALSAQYVSLTIPLEFGVGAGNTIVVQEILDSIVPGLLPLAVVFGLYFLVKSKKFNYSVISLGTIAICILGSLIGIF